MTEVVNNTYAGTGTTMGNTPGDVVIAIDLLTQQSDIDRLNAGDMIFGWDGKVPESQDTQTEQLLCYNYPLLM